MDLIGAGSLGACFGPDRRRLRALLRSGASPRRAQREVRASILRVRERRAARPTVHAWPDLPITPLLDQIGRAIESRPVVVVRGETGSGKSTQLPKLCLSIGRGAAGLIAHTQPRRLAARSVAARVAEELGVELGGVVGYQVRFTDRTGPATMLSVMTDGVLLAQMQRDRWLERYDTVIVDEAHERTLNIDLLLGALRRLVAQRDDLRVIVTSATIDAGQIASYFGDADGPAPVFEVPGRSFPIRTLYRPVDPGTDDLSDPVAQAVEEVCGEGDVLVFLPGEREIREAARAIHKRRPDLDLLPLYARLPLAEQRRVFAPHGGRRVVLATNVAETAITVPGVRAVVDTGLARVSRYSPRTRTQRLPVEPISRASADQRRGRCGRVGAGVCVRLYSEDDERQRPEFDQPEILRTNLASVILQVKALRLGDIETFPFIQPPDVRRVRDGYETLRELDAIDSHGRLTAIGRRLARLPLDPRYGRVLLAASEQGCLSEAAVVVSFLSVQDPRDRPHDDRERADAAHARFADGESDFVTVLNLWEHLRRQSRSMGSSGFRRACREQYISAARFREWQDVHRQVREVARDMGLAGAGRSGERRSARAALHKALLAGFLSSVGRREAGGGYAGVRGLRFSIHPSSSVFGARAEWVVATDLVRTTRLWAHYAGRVHPRWIERAGAHALQRTCSDPHWDQARQRVSAYERVSLWGLELAAGRKVPYGRIDPRAARELFILHALVDGRLRSDAPFLAHNRRVVERLGELAARARRPDLGATGEACFAFYDARVGLHVHDRRSFEEWRRSAERRRPRALFMRRRDLVRPADVEGLTESYPGHIASAGSDLPLAYAFDPGRGRDGATLHVPVEALPNLDAQRCAWLIPGLIREKVEAMVRGLPRVQRRAFGSIGAFAEDFVAQHPFGVGSLFEAVAHHARRTFGVDVSAQALRDVALPPHLMLKVRVLDPHGRLLAESTDPEGLCVALRAHVRRALDMAEHPAVRRRVLSWDMDELPQRVELERHGASVPAFVAMTDREGCPAVALFPRADEAEGATRAGLRRLFWITAADELAQQGTRFPEMDRLAAALGDPAKGRRRILEHVVDRAFRTADPVCTRDAFQERLGRGIDALDDATRLTCDLLCTAVSARDRALASLQAVSPDPEGITAQEREHLSVLLGNEFPVGVPPERLAQVPLILSGVCERIASARRAPGADAQRWEEIKDLWEWFVPRWRRALHEGVVGSRLEAMRWRLEELRLAVLTPQVGATEGVSVQRVRREFADVLADPWHR